MVRFHPRLSDLYEIRADGGSDLVLRSTSARVLVIDELTDLTLKAGNPDGGVGPYIVQSLGPNHLTLRAFSGYYGGTPALTSVEFITYRSQRAAWTGMMRDEIDALYEVNREALEFVEREARVRTHSFLRAYVAALAFNVRSPQFRDPKSRRALSIALDRGQVVKSAYRGRARPASGPLVPTHWSLSEQTPRIDYNASLAKSLLDEFPLTAAGGQMPARIRFRCLVPAFETQPLERIALAIQKQLYGFGVDVQLEPVSVPRLITRLRSGDFDAVLMEFYSAGPTWLSAFWHSPKGSAPILINSGYSAADAELEAMEEARSEGELRLALSAVYKKMAEDPPAIFIAWPEVARAVSTRFEVPVEKGRDIMGSNLWLWRPAKQQ